MYVLCISILNEFSIPDAYTLDSALTGIQKRTVVAALLKMTNDRPLDEDAEGFEKHFDDADDEAFPYIQQYYASLTPDLVS